MSTMCISLHFLLILCNMGQKVCRYVIGPGMKWKNLYVYSSIRQYENMQRRRRKAEDRPENRNKKTYKLLHMVRNLPTKNDITRQKCWQEGRWLNTLIGWQQYDFMFHIFFRYIHVPCDSTFPTCLLRFRFFSVEKSERNVMLPPIMSES